MFEKYEFTVPEYYLPAIFNDDYSGLDDEEEAALKDFLDSLEHHLGEEPCGHWAMDNDAEAYFAHSNDVTNEGCNVIDIYWMQLTDSEPEAPTLKDREIRPEFVLVHINETKDWSEDVQQKFGEIWCTYMYDKNEVTNLCSFEVNYWLIPIQYDSPNITEELWDELIDLQADYMDAIYARVRYIDSIDEEHKDNDWSRHCDLADYEDSEDGYDELINDLIEAYEANPVWC